MKMKDYLQPAMIVIELRHERDIMLMNSREGYGRDGSGYSDSNIGDRSGYDDDGDGWSNSNVGIRYGYDWDSSGWD